MIGVCEETQLRIRVAVYAWAYEVHDDPLVSDAVFDHTARKVDLERSTSRPDIDEWFRDNFNPSTGVWVRSHPEPEGLERIYRMLRADIGRTITGNALHVWMVAA